jgi:lipopolysaccharide transport system permease protein
MVSFAAVACKSTILSITDNRELLWEVAIRDLRGKNRGAILGFAWSVLSPFIQVVAYVAIVSFVFRARLGETAGRFDYAVYVLSGMIPWQILTLSIQQAPTLIRNNTELVKQVIYPIQTLPLTSMITNSFGSVVSFLVFLLLSLFSGSFRLTFFLLPIPLILVVLLVLGLSWIFSIAGILIKDLKEMVTVVMSVLVYFSPVVASEEITGAKVWKIIRLNPLSHVVICFRDVFQATFHLESWVVFVTAGLGLFIIGAMVITKTRLLINEYV